MGKRKNHIGVTAGRCFNPLISPSIFYTPFLLLNGDNNLVASLEGEKDLVLQNFCCYAEAVDKNKGLGNRTVFLAYGLFLGDILFAKYWLFSLSNSLIFGGETLKLIRERALEVMVYQTLIESIAIFFASPSFV